MGEMADFYDGWDWGADYPRIKRCYRCGADIELRESRRSGRWLPYEAYGTRLHRCGAKRALEDAIETYGPLPE